MQHFEFVRVCSAFALACGWLVNLGATAEQAQPKFGMQQRTPWTVSRIEGSPDPPRPYRCERVYPKLNFSEPTVITTAAGSNRWFVAQRGGKIYSFVKDPGCDQADLFLDISAELLSDLPPDSPVGGFSSCYGLEFHPDFQRNRLCFVCYVVTGKEPGQYGQGTRVSRFRVTEDDPPRIDPDSEEVIITWMQGGHNGGCLKFGPRDGYLYISTGDGGNAFPPDGHNAGQDVTNLLSSVLRIDVDRSSAGRPYAVPPDNPFVDLDQARPEIWSYGFRNPWKMSFDRETGDLWVGDVGWELWELVYRVVRGGNFGWSITEGRQPVHMERTRGPTPILPPALDIPHLDGASITGGFVYRGQRHPDLVGEYVFGDWETRRIWGARFDGQQLIDRRDLTEPTVRIVGFAEDHEGELLLMDYDDGTLHRLVANEPQDGPQHPFPRKLSESGLFSSTASHQPSPGVLPFSVNAPRWADQATAERMIGIPGDASIMVHDKPQRIAGSMFSRRMDFPANTVLAKTLSLETSRGNPQSRRRVETQMLHFDGRTWRGYSYAWNDEQTDAVLVDAAGKDRVFAAQDPQEPGGVRKQTWHFPSRAQCGRCHNPWAEHTLAFNLQQLDKSHDYGSATADQLATLHHIGIFEWVQPDSGAGQDRSTERPTVTRLVDPYDERADLESRARSYLHVNCAHCHRFNGGGVSYIELRSELALDKTKTLGTRPTQGTFGIHNAQIIAPGDPYRSVLFYRLAKLARGRMPYIGSDVLDRQGLVLMHRWISSLTGPSEQGVAGDQLRTLDEQLVRAVSDSEAVDQLLESTSGALRLAWAAAGQELPDTVRRRAVTQGSEHPDVQIRDLFEAFLPPELRSQRLGSVVRLEQILELSGDAERGQRLFHNTEGIQCQNCHQINGQGKAIGPDLSRIGQQQGRIQLLQNLLEPSRNIDPKFVTYLVETHAGRVFSGLLVERTSEAMLLLDAQGKKIRVSLDEVEQSAPQRKSLMPDLLLRDMTADQVADLLAYLSSLK